MGLQQLYAPVYNHITTQLNPNSFQDWSSAMYTNNRKNSCEVFYNHKAWEIF